MTKLLDIGCFDIEKVLREEGEIQLLLSEYQGVEMLLDEWKKENH